MKKTIFLQFFVMHFLAYSQVGINTPTPQKTLHVNGALQITNELNLGGNASSAGSPGAARQIMQSNGPGVAPSWISLEQAFIPKTTIVGTKSNVSPSSGTFTGNTTNPIVFNSIPKIDNTNMTYNSTTGVITIVKAGYYQVVVYLTYDLNTNPNGETSGTAISDLSNITTNIAIAKNTTNHSERTPYVYHNLVGTAFFSVGDQIAVRGLHTRQYKLSSSSISAVYVSE